MEIFLKMLPKILKIRRMIPEIIHKKQIKVKGNIKHHKNLKLHKVEKESMIIIIKIILKNIIDKNEMIIR